MNKYPNLNELIKCHPYSEHTICDHAQIEPELLHAALDGTEVLTPTEIIAIARLYGCPIGVLNDSKLIMLDMNRSRHRKMVNEVKSIYIQLKGMTDEGNHDAVKYSEWADWEFRKFMYAVRSNKFSYCHYLGIKEQLTQYVSFVIPKPKRRGPAAI